MSRCFPFPPKGNCGSNEALIVSIKLQEERENSILDGVIRKEENPTYIKTDRKRNKNEKKKVQKDEKIVTKETFEQKQNLSGKSDKVGNVQEKLKREGSFETFEQSNLTVEHGLPVVSQYVSSSPDSTGNSCKRRRCSSPANSVHRNGNVILIRLSSRKRDDHGVLVGLRTWKAEDHPTSLGELRPWSTLKLSFSDKDVMAKVQEPCIFQKDAIARVIKPLISQQHLIFNGQESSIRLKDAMSKVQEPIGPKVVKSKIVEPSISRKDGASKIQGPLRSALTDTPTLELVHDKKTESREDHTSSGRIMIREPSLKKISSREKKMLKRELMYKKLFRNLAPISFECNLVDNQVDDEWLFGKKNEESAVKRQKGASVVEQPFKNNLPCSRSAVLQPRSHFLSDVGVYALPFTVPF